MRTALLIAALASSTLAQIDPIIIQRHAQQLDSGYIDNTSTSPRIVFSADLGIPQVSWFRIFFARTNLPIGSEIRMTSHADGAIQRHTAQSLVDYSDSSAWFNGDKIKLELIAGPGTRANRVLIINAESGSADTRGGDSICGNTDDRKLSQDPRVGRAVSGASACSWWLIDEFTILTAGHCTTSVSKPLIVGFNIPLSTPAGVYVQPHPDHQYPVDTSTLQYSTGFGNDWAVVASLRNSNHGLYPGQKQGAWFNLGTIPNTISGQTIRITGNGRVTSPVSPTWNAVQKTHVGPLSRTSNYLQYRTDTTGGNSGSPVIHEQTGDAIGVHTHGGCGSSGGANSGTRIDRSNFMAAIQAVRNSKVAGSTSLFGQGCGGAQLSFDGIPELGQNLTVKASGLPSQHIGSMLIGFSKTAWQSFSLPLDLSPYGFAGCQLYTDIVIDENMGSGGTTASLAITLPNTPAVVGSRSYFQYLAVTPGLGAVLTNAGEVLIGG